MKTNQKVKKKESDKAFNLFSAVAAALVWGSWAYYINEGSIMRKLYSGVAQGISSFSFTLLFIIILTKIYYSFPKKPLFFFVPTILTVSLSGTILVIVHTLVHTPNILYTIAPSITISVIFAICVTLKLRMSDNKKSEK